jgi:uncharacterized protein YjiS (DUF1127 family)
MIPLAPLRDLVANNILRSIFKTHLRAGGAAVRRLARWRNYRRTLNALKRLDETGLRDLGISRSDFDCIARGEIVRD